MDPITLDVLEFPKVIDLVAGFASSSPGRKHVNALEPLDSLEEILRQLSLVTEMTELMSRGTQPDLSGLTDIGPSLASAARPGSVLSETEIVRVGRFLEVVRGAVGFFRGKEKRYPLLCELAGRLTPREEVRRRIDSAIDPETGVKDGASRKLKQIRIQLVETRSKLRDRLNRLIVDWELAEASVVFRSGRFCLPVPAAVKGRVKGFVLDRSDSGQTFFVEPLPVLELNNNLRELTMDEGREIRKILLELTDMIREAAPDCRESQEVLTEIDSVLARSRFGWEMDGGVPAIKETGPLRLRKARHPLLVAREKERSGEAGGVVPLDLELSDDIRVLLISGPNAGGKTVALKTAGLLCLLTRAGIPIPASPDSEIVIYDHVLADIGDRQSIEEDISTFSAHVRRLIDILAAAGTGSLVIIDEIGAGTDPGEGASLAWALLERLADSGCTTLASTHYGNLKALVSSRDDMANGSLEFDGEQLIPTYRFNPGIPGSSFGLEIARRLGLEAEVIDRAEKRLPEPDRRLEKLLQELETERFRYRRESEKVRAEDDRLAELILEYQEKLGGVKREARAITEEAGREAAALLESGRARIEKAVKEIRRSGASKESIKDARGDLNGAIADLKRVRDKGRPRSPEMAAALVPGASVRLSDMERSAVVLDAPGADGMLLLELGHLRLRVHKSRIAAVGEKTADRPKGAALDRIGFQPAGEGATAELDLRGQTQEEAEAAVEKYLDDARLSGISIVRIIHGKGTGALRRTVNEVLSGHRHVKQFQLGSHHEGGSGVTVAELSD